MNKPKGMLFKTTRQVCKQPKSYRDPSLQHNTDLDMCAVPNCLIFAWSHAFAMTQCQKQ
jgi:hypothetical protein